MQANDSEMIKYQQKELTACQDRLARAKSKIVDIDSRLTPLITEVREKEKKIAQQKKEILSNENLQKTQEQEIKKIRDQIAELEKIRSSKMREKNEASAKLQKAQLRSEDYNKEIKRKETYIKDEAKGLGEREKELTLESNKIKGQLSALSQQLLDLEFNSGGTPNNQAPTSTAVTSSNKPTSSNDPELDFLNDMPALGNSSVYNTNNSSKARDSDLDFLNDVPALANFPSSGQTSSVASANSSSSSSSAQEKTAEQKKREAEEEDAKLIEELKRLGTFGNDPERLKNIVASYRKHQQETQMNTSTNNGDVKLSDVEVSSNSNNVGVFTSQVNSVSAQPNTNTSSVNSNISNNNSSSNTFNNNSTSDSVFTNNVASFWQGARQELKDLQQTNPNAIETLKNSARNLLRATGDGFERWAVRFLANATTPQEIALADQVIKDVRDGNRIIETATKITREAKGAVDNISTQGIIGYATNVLSQQGNNIADRISDYTTNLHARVGLINEQARRNINGMRQFGTDTLLSTDNNKVGNGVRDINNQLNNTR